MEMPFALTFGKLKNLTQIVYVVTIENKITLGNTFLQAFKPLELEGHKGP